LTASDRYKSPEAFKTALEQRVRGRATSEDATIDRVRQLLIFDRFMARAIQAFGNRLLLKGGVVLELRLERARTTTDIDWRMIDTPPAKVREELQRAGVLDLGDYMTFLVTENRDAPTIEGTVYDGVRFPAEARLAGKIYGSPFGVDVAFGDPLVGAIDTLAAPQYLDFVDVPATAVRLYPRPTHVAEKLHAFTLPRPTSNSRVKDLPDIALLAQTGPFSAEELRQALDATFRFRGTHALPTSVPPAPLDWGLLTRGSQRRTLCFGRIFPR
jgi:nucleotidyltransferase AbiEii toxin of type IV toxin-antitoxin system